MNLVERLRAHDMQTSPDWPDKAAMYAWMDQADKLLSEAAAELSRLQKEIEAAREALEPFVRQMEREFPDQWPDAMDVRSLNESRWHLKVGDFRRAREAYAAIKDKEVAG